jgi:hypothetical protein
MAVHPQRSTWTDERLDDLSQVMRDGFARTDAELRALRQETRDGLDRLSTEMRDGFARQDERSARNDDRFDALQRALIIAMAGLITAVFVSNLLG